jgi:hypothetical protein
MRVYELLGIVDQAGTKALSQEELHALVEALALMRRAFIVGVEADLKIARGWKPEHVREFLRWTQYVGNFLRNHGVVNDEELKFLIERILEIEKRRGQDGQMA